jgi:CHAT domain-containing protein
VTIIPYGILFGVPFGALEDSEGQLLIERHTLVYSPSISVLRFTRENRDRLPSDRTPSLLALVNPSPMPYRDSETRYESLEYTEHLFAQISKFYAGKTTILQGRKATKQALFASAGKASVLQLVTHAQFVKKDGKEEKDKTNSLPSHIALSATPSTEDGYLQVPEVFRLRLNADLVLLWACETGLGELSPDGVEGFSRAFTWAGAPSLMASLWSIPESNSFSLMYSFHEAWLKRHRTKAQALRDAMVKHSRQERKNPGYWGGFVLYGEGD